MIEVWKDIEGYEGLYQVSNLGRVKALKKEWSAHHTAVLKHREIIMKPFSNHGYLRITLSKNNAYQKFPIHRLVANAFIGKQPTPQHRINHKDFNRQNNCVDNLEWLTQKENVLYSRENSRKAKLNKLKPKSKEHYITYRKLATCERWSIYIRHKYYQFKTIEEAIAFRDKHLKDLLIGKDVICRQNEKGSTNNANKKND